MKFSVLMSVYKNEKPEYLDIAINSIYNKQSLKPDEIVLIKDGPLNVGLDMVIDKYKQELKDIFRVIALEKNVGLSEALNIGIKACKYPLIARMDSDDISREDRFEKQINILSNNPDIDVVGSWISEFEGDEENIYATRKLPVSIKELNNFARFRCPVNHMSVIYKKDKVIEVGNYNGFRGIEDYFLWAKMLMNGSNFVNIPEYLVNARAGSELSKRRGGIKYALMELRLQIKFFSIGFINFPILVKNTVIKFIARIAPNFFREKLYKISRKAKFYRVVADRNLFFDLKYSNTFNSPKIANIKHSKENE